MPTLHIDGIGEVKVDESFRSLSPADQQKTVDEIIESVGGARSSEAPDRPQGAPRHQGTDGTLEAALMDAFPQARVTGRGRTASRNAQVNGVPDSYHLDHDALDVSLPGVSVAQVRKAFADRGIPLNEALIHDAGSGKHLHIAWDGNGGDPNLQPTAPQVDDTPIMPLPAAPMPKSGGPVAPLPKAPVSYQTKPQASAAPGGPNVVMRHANAFNEGLADTLGLPVDAMNGLMKAVGLPMGDHPFGGSESIRSGLRALGMEHDTDQEKGWAPQSGLERYTQSAARGVGQSIIPAAGVEAMAGRTAARTAPEILRSLGIEARAGAGAGLGAQAANDLAPGNPVAALAGSLVGGGLGAGAVGDLRKMAQEAQVRRFVSDQASGNPHVATDATVAGDLKTVLANLPTKAGGKPLAKALTDRTALSRIDALDASYMPDINGYDLLPSQRSTLRTAMANRQVLTSQEIEGLRSIPQAGDVVANAITKSQRLRNAVPEVLGNGSRVNPVLGMIGDSAATATGAALGGPKGAMLGRFASAGVGHALRGDPARAAVKLAETRAALADAYGRAASKAADASPTASTVDDLTNLVIAKATIRKGRDVAPDGDNQPVPDNRLPETGATPWSTVAARNAALEDQLNAANAAEGAKTGRLVVDIVGGADPAPTDVRDTAFLKAQADKLAKADEARKAVQLATDNRRVGIANDRDNIVPGGGWRGHVYDRTGLKPADQDTGALMLLQDGTISPSQFQAHLSNPADLMSGNAGNAIVDRLGAMADQGTLLRDPNWTPPTQAAPAQADGSTFIANPEAYRATAKGNQDRVTQAMQAATDHPALDPDAKTSIKSALATLGNTSDRSTADALVSDTVDSLPDDVKADALSILQPVASAIRKRR